jgi:ABC-2 type transport system ATP-binding protein
MSDTTVIDCRGLTKRYHGTHVDALHGLNLKVQAGEIYGFLGPNGAGKSTTIRTLLNFIQPTGGTASILGMDIVNDSVAIKREIGYLSSDLSMYPKLTGHQFLDYMGELQPGTVQTYRRELTERLKPQLDKKLGDLSRGNKQKVGIIQAMMHRPKVLIMDEPSSGLDPLMQEAFYELLGEFRKDGAAIFLSSHIFGEVQKICNRVGIIREGRLIVERDITEMAKDAAHTFDITFADKPPLAELRRLPDVTMASHHGNNVRVHVRGPMAPLLRELSKHEVVQLDAHQLDLEEMFMRYYDGSDE